MKIGITERGDAGADLSWYDRLDTVSGAILITKDVNDNFIEKVMQAYQSGYKLIVHATCTGWGSSMIESGVPLPLVQLKQLCKLIENGFPIEQCVLRIDPIIPNKEGLNKVCDVLNLAFSMNLLPRIRVRISVLDEYPHVKERFRKIGLKPVYGQSFYAPKAMMEEVYNTLSRYDIQFHTCAEPYLTAKDGTFVHSGCVSEIDLRILGIQPDDTANINPQNRNGCKCLSCKTELLTCKHPCKHQCKYCYWK